MLSHVRVVDLTGERGGLAAHLLAQYGADVVRVVPPRLVAPADVSAADVGVPPSAHAAAFARGTRTVTLDLHDAAAAERIDAFVAAADVVIESLSAPDRQRLGLDPHGLGERHPRLVHASLTPFGLTGPKADWAATDLTIMASASPLSVTGDADRPPVRMTVPQACSFAAAHAAGAVLIALYERDRSGRGQHIDVSAQQSAASATQAGLLTEAIGAPRTMRSAGGARMGDMVLRFMYPAADGFVSITHVFGEVGGAATSRLMDWVHEAGFCDVAMRDKDWIRYAELIDSGEESTESWEEVKEAVAAFTSSLPKADLLIGAVERKLLLAPVNDLGEVLELPHLKDRAFFETMTPPGGGRPLRVPGRYARFSGWTPEPLGPPTDVEGDGDRPWPGREGVGGGPVTPPAAAHDRPALEGLRVVDLTWSVAGPAMMRVLADHGATVVKVESTTRLDPARAFLPFHSNEMGVENSALYDNLNAGKQSITLDVGRPEGRQVLDDLIAWADVVVDALSPRGRRSMALDRIAEVNPTAVAMSVSLFGLDGPLASLAGYGNLGAAVSGCYDLTGWADRPPAGPYLAYTDYTSAPLMLVSVMTALIDRQRSGRGRFIELSQTETALQFLAPGLLVTEVSGAAVSRAGNDDATMAPHGVYPCVGEEHWVALACGDDEGWGALCRLMGQDQLADDPELATADDRLRHRRRLDELVAAWTTGCTADEVTARCQAAGVAAHTVQNSAECLADPQLAAREHFVTLDHPHRLCLVEGTRFRLARTPGAPRRRAPTLGEHTFEVLTGILGYDTDRVAELAAAELLE